MANSYLVKYLKIYLWQGLAFLLRFVSLFIVTPFLSKEPSIYGIYAVCMSVTIYLNYADLGFLRAGTKYAAESFARNEIDEEKKFIGFGTFILLIFSMLCAIVFYYLSLNPQQLIKGLDSPIEIATASKLLLILVVFTPVTVFQRMVLMVFDIRLESYKFQRLSLISSLITLASVLYFFCDGNYRIVDYFLFSQTMAFIVSIISFLLAQKLYNYDFGKLFSYIRFNLDVFNKVKNLAFSGLYIMLVWIVFYELDTITIGKFLGAEKVALFAVAWTFATIFRNIYGIIFSPFAIRANHFVGTGDEDGLRKFCLQIFSITAPVVIIPTVAFSLIAKPFILTWVGSRYLDSVSLATLFPFLFTLSFISYTSSMVLVAKVKNKEMAFIATVQPIIYWVGIFFTCSTIGLLSFAVFKVLATVVSEICYFILLTRILDLNWRQLIEKAFSPVVLPLTFLIISLFISNHFFVLEKSKLNLFIVVATTGICTLISLSIMYFSNPEIKVFAGTIFKNSTMKTSL